MEHARLPVSSYLHLLMSTSLYACRCTSKQGQGVLLGVLPADLILKLRRWL